MVAEPCDAHVRLRRESAPADASGGAHCAGRASGFASMCRRPPALNGLKFAAGDVHKQRSPGGISRVEAQDGAVKARCPGGATKTPGPWHEEAKTPDALATVSTGAVVPMVRT